MANTKKSTTKSKPKPKTTTKSTAKSSSKEKQQYVPSEKEIKIRNEILLLFAFAITVLIELSCLGFLSPLGDYISYFVFGLFGFTGYIIPIVIFLGVAFLISNLKNRVAVIKFSAGSVLVLLCSAYMHMLFVGQSEHGAGYFYMLSGREKSGGGFFGSLISGSLCNIIGTIGTFLILLLLTIVCLVIITEKSFIGGVKRGSKKIYDTAVYDAVKIRENAENYARERSYQKKNKRVDKKVKGVNLTKLENPEKQDEDIHEITSVIPENSTIYRGKVDIDRMERINAQVNVPDNSEPVMDEKPAVKKETFVPPSKPEYLEELKDDNYDEIHYDEEGYFRPKENIEVSQTAKNIMSRKPYSGIAPKQQVSSKPVAENSPKAKQQEPKGHAARRYILPKTDLLTPGRRAGKVNELELMETAEMLQKILLNFGVKAEVTEYQKGPAVTRYEVQPEIGTRLSKITALADDIKLNLAATDIRIEPIPGKSTIGIEVPNKKRESVYIRDLIESKELTANKSFLAFAAGMDIAGNVVVGDIAKMPHMLVAGTTGSGKSVFTNSIIMSILFRATPDEVRLIIVDPKVVEFGVYNGIPHLLQPVVTDPKLASNTLKWAVNEMSERYKKFADLNVRDLKGYNEKAENPEDRMPQIVIVIDELADLMMVAAKEVEESICRLAQLARAAGIHLVIATQRPSVDVVTGLIKANIPSRVALMVSSGVDSRTIIDSNGAEKLLGNGDMLFYPSGYVKPVRLQGAFVSDSEVQKVVEFWKAQAGENTYDDSIANFVASQPSSATSSATEDDDGRDEYFMEAAKFCIEKQKASTSMLQRMFRIGFNRASRIIDQLEDAGVIGPEEGTKPRRVLITLDELNENISN